MKDSRQTFRTGAGNLAKAERPATSPDVQSGPANRTIAAVIAGVAGVGKTAVGLRAAERLGWDFQDADDFHAPASVEKMRRGIPLTDEDRAAWLDSLRGLLRHRLDEGRSTVVACSALKQSYRKALLQGNAGAVIVFLKAPKEVVRQRIRARHGHFFDPELLDSQYDVLEEPVDGLVVDATRPIEDVVDDVVDLLREAAAGVNG